MFTRKFKAVQTIGKFTNDQGEEKFRYQQLGIVLENENGQLSLKLNALPLPNEKGEVWVNFYPVESKEESSSEEK